MRFPEDVPLLTDGNVTLRAHTVADIPAAYDVCQDAEMQRWTTIPLPYEWQHAEQYLTEFIPAGWRDGSSWAWAIEYDGRYAGTIDLRPQDGNLGEVGFAVAPWARGNGVMTSALGLAVGYAFEQGWDRVVWRAYVGNWGSRRVAWKCGFRNLVTIPAGGLQRGVRRDEWVASIAREDAPEPQGNWWRVPLIETGKVRLRAFRSTDSKRLAEACDDVRTQEWLAGLPNPYQVEDAEGFIESRKENLASGEGVSWAIADPDTDELLGCVSVFDLKNRIDATMGEIGYWAHPGARGQGVMSAAVRAVIGHAFTPVADGGLGRRRLVLFAAEGNRASQRVAEVNGFTRTGRERAASPGREGVFRDLHSFDLLITDSRA
jgi:RimJ/RimL family protein N-acetyltransferase